MERAGRMKPEDRKRLKQHIEMIVEHKEPIESQTEKILRDAVEEQIKGKTELEDKNRKLRLELRALHFKEAQENRFVWWIYQVYARNVLDLVQSVPVMCPCDTEEDVPFIELAARIKEYTEHIYDGTYLDTAMSTEQSNSDVSVTQDVLTDIKTGQSIEKETCSWIQEDDPDICYWKTGCGNSFYFTEGTPTDNNMKYCCYCGKLLKQEE